LHILGVSLSDGRGLSVYKKAQSWWRKRPDHQGRQAELRKSGVLPQGL